LLSLPGNSPPSSLPFLDHRLKSIELQELSLEPFKWPLSAKPSEHFAKDRTGKAKGFPADATVQPTRFRIASAPEIADPNGRIDKAGLDGSLL
jgi:hypothetical protein